MTLASPCPDDAVFVALVEGRLGASETATLHRHADSCEACRALVRGLSASTAGGPLGRVGPDERARPAKVGRYFVLSLIGRGGMGEVYEAYDPQLDRRVAIKLLRTATESPAARRRLSREAWALAQLSHPNVVHVYDVGEQDGDVFIAMELVEGESLDAWCHGPSRRDWRAVLAAYLDAARGLAAAHEKGLVHRDVKPANILRGKDGRVRVVDFGLVSGGDEVGEPVEGPVAAATVGDLRLTATGALLGTPLYMAPEQLERGQASAASDQYGLCVGLYEGIRGELPFDVGKGAAAQRSLASLLSAKKRPPRPAPRGSKIPARVFEAVARGLAPDPADRHASMAALVETLATASASPEPIGARRLAVAAGAALVAVLVAALGIRQLGSHAGEGNASLATGETRAVSSFPRPEGDPPYVVLALDAARGLTRDARGIARWADQSGNGNDASAGTQTPAPTFVEDVGGGFPAVHFEGGSNLHIPDSASLHLGTRNFAVCLVARHDQPEADLAGGWGITAGYGLLYTKSEEPEPYRGISMFVNYPQPVPSTKMGVQTSWDHVALSAPGLNDRRLHLLCAHRAEGTLEARVDGVVQGRVVAPDDVSAVGRPVFIGAQPNADDSTTIQQLKGDVAEVMVLLRPGAREFERVEAALLKKFGLGPAARAVTDAR